MSEYGQVKRYGLILVLGTFCLAGCATGRQSGSGYELQCRMAPERSPAPCADSMYHCSTLTPVAIWAEGYDEREIEFALWDMRLRKDVVAFKRQLLSDFRPRLLWANGRVSHDSNSQPLTPYRGIAPPDPSTVISQSGESLYPGSVDSPLPPGLYRAQILSPGTPSLYRYLGVSAKKGSFVAVGKFSKDFSTIEVLPRVTPANFLTVWAHGYSGNLVVTFTYQKTGEKVASLETKKVLEPGTEDLKLRWKDWNWQKHPLAPGLYRVELWAGNELQAATCFELDIPAVAKTSGARPTPSGKTSPTGVKTAK